MSTWRVVLLPHQVWALLSVQFLLVIVLARHARVEWAERHRGEAVPAQ